MPERSPDEILATAVESSRNIKFGRGVVSKTSYVAALAMAVWGVVAWRWSENLIADVGLLVIGAVSTGFACWYINRCHEFAERNPAQALLEGAEFLEWSRLEAAAKGLAAPPPGQPQIEIKPARLPADGQSNG
jgi:hypothetical protein